MRPLRIVAKDGSDILRRMSRDDLRRTYRRLRTEVGMTPWQARSIITDIALSASYRRPQR